MKVLVVSDIHSNIWALEEILNQEQEYDLICCAGDFVDYGTAPKQVVDWAILQKNAFFVQGNHDLHVVNTWQTGEYTSVTSKEYKWVHYNCEHLSKEHIGFLKGLPRSVAFEADGISYVMQHQYGTGYGIVESSYQFNRIWDEQGRRNFAKEVPQKRCMIFGHTHRQCWHVLEDTMLWLNPGSISYRRPDDPDKTAHYAVIIDGQISLRRTPYNAAPLLAEAKRLHRENHMMETELQDFYFFFGNAVTTRDPLL